MALCLKLFILLALWLCWRDVAYWHRNGHITSVFVCSSCEFSGAHDSQPTAKLLHLQKLQLRGSHGEIFGMRLANGGPGPLTYSDAWVVLCSLYGRLLKAGHGMQSTYILVVQPTLVSH